MTPRSLLLLAGTTLLAILLAWGLQREHRPDPPGEFLLPGLASQLDELSALELHAAGSEAFRIERSADGWRAPAKGGYPVDAGKVRRFVLRLAQARVVATKTSRPELHDRLGVADVDADAGTGVVVRLEGAGELPGIVVGQREARGLQGTHVRREGEDTALLVDQELQPDREATQWLQRELLDIAADELQSLRIVHPDGEVLAVSRDDLGIFVLEDLPEDRTLAGPTGPEALARALTGLRMDDVRPADGWAPEGTPTQAEFRLRNGMVVEARSWAADEETWVAFAARVEMTGNEASTGAGTAGEAAGDDEVQESEPPAEETAAVLNQRLGPWLFRLPAWKQEVLLRRVEDLLQPVAD
jgi:hypothetical protein